MTFSKLLPCQGYQANDSVKIYPKKKKRLCQGIDLTNKNYVKTQSELDFFFFFFKEYSKIEKALVNIHFEDNIAGVD